MVDPLTLPSAVDAASFPPCMLMHQEAQRLFLTAQDTANCVPALASPEWQRLVLLAQGDVALDSEFMKPIVGVLDALLSHRQQRPTANLIPLLRHRVAGAEDLLRLFHTEDYKAFLVCKTDMQLADISKLNHLLEANPQMCPRYQRPLESDGGQPCHGNLKDIMTLSMAIDIAIDHVVSALRRPYSHVDSIVLERTAREAVVSVGDCFMYDDMVDLSYEGSHCPALANPLSPQDLAMPCYPYSRPRAARGSSLHQVTCLEPTMSMEAACPQQQSPGQDAMSGPKTNHQGRGTQLYSLPRAYTHPLESKDKLECPKGAA
ncbi:hypothetical protein ABBQ32_004304 [Trebouxia sp. C0010 RCD-2024]